MAENTQVTTQDLAAQLAALTAAMTQQQPQATAPNPFVAQQPNPFAQQTPTANFRIRELQIPLSINAADGTYANPVLIIETETMTAAQVMEIYKTLYAQGYPLQFKSPWKDNKKSKF